MKLIPRHPYDDSCVIQRVQLGKWIYTLRWPVSWLGQHNDNYPDITVVLRSPITRVLYISEDLPF